MKRKVLNSGVNGSRTLEGMKAYSLNFLFWEDEGGRYDMSKNIEGIHPPIPPPLTPMVRNVNGCLTRSTLFLQCLVLFG